MAPLISVIIPVFNSEKYLKEAVQSIHTQNYSPLEILIVDDGSTDGSYECFQSDPWIRCFRQVHKGAAAARNCGLSYAKGDYLAFLDADDLWTPDKLSGQMIYLDEHPETDMVFGKIEQFISPEIPDDQCPVLPDDRRIMNGFHVGAMLIRRPSFERVGGFVEDLRIGEFIEWYARAQQMGMKSAILDQVVMRRRIHLQNLTIREKQAQGDYLRAIKSALDRRKTLGQR